MPDPPGNNPPTHDVVLAGCHGVAFIDRAAGHQGRRPSKQKEANMGYGLVGILLIILLVVLIVYFVRRA